MSEYQEHLPERLGELVVARRKELGWTQEQLAEKADVVELTIRKIEHGKGNPQMKVLIPLMKALRISPTALFEETNEDSKPAQTELLMLLDDCSNEEILEIIPIVDAAKKIIKKITMK